MPRLSIDTDEFADYVAAFLLDKMNNMDTVVPGNENFNDFCEILKHKGTRATLITYYMHMDPQTRVRYRLIRNVFITDGKLPTADLHITKTEPPLVPKPKRTLLKKVLAAGLAIITGKSIVDKIRK